jgi:hypothetical protein
MSFMGIYIYIQHNHTCTAIPRALPAEEPPACSPPPRTGLASPRVQPADTVPVHAGQCRYILGSAVTYWALPLRFVVRAKSELHLCRSQTGYLQLATVDFVCPTHTHIQTHIHTHVHARTHIHTRTHTHTICKEKLGSDSHRMHMAH